MVLLLFCQDAHEFLCQVLDQLKDEVAALSNKESTDSSPNCTVKEEVLEDKV